MKAVQAKVGRLLLAGLLAMAVSTAFAAKNPDKPEKPDKVEKRIDKIERKIERAGLGDAEEAPALPPPRAVMGAAAPSAPPERSRADRSSRSERGERPDRTEASDGRTGGGAPADATYDKFRLITERNIFNPNRTGRTREAPVEKPPRVDQISLVGTVQYSGRLVAFFDSPDSNYKKHLGEGDSIAEFKVQKITADGVELTRDDKPLALRVTQQLRRPEGGDWTVIGATPGRSEGRGGTNPDDIRAAAAAAAQQISTTASDKERELMERRAKQLKR